MKCENCGKEHNGNYASGRFCSKECAKSFSTKNDNKQLKEAKCVNCGKYFLIGKRASLNNCKCKECSIKKVKCNICGKEHNLGEKCNNVFCFNHNILGFKLLIESFGFDKSKLGTPEVENEFNRIRNIIYKLYWEDNLCAKEIANKFNFKSKHSIGQTVFKFLDIPLRNVKTSAKNAVLTGRLKPSCSYMYKSKTYTTWNGKEVFLRSSYEEDYAKELDEQKIDYDVECLRIKYFDTKINEYCIAIPDFYIPSENMIVEIKSNWTLDIQEMKDKLKAYLEQGYKFKLILEHKEVDINTINETDIHPSKKEYSIYRILGSAYGTCWVYNDVESKKIKKEQLDECLLNGWMKGRKMKF